MVNKVMKTKVTNIFKGKEKKEKKERIDMQSYIEVDEDLYTLKINCKGKRTVGKAKKRNT